MRVKNLRKRSNLHFFHSQRIASQCFGTYGTYNKATVEEDDDGTKGQKRKKAKEVMMMMM